MNLHHLFAWPRRSVSQPSTTIKPFLEVLEDRSVPSVSGFIALVGGEAESFTIPDDVRLLTQTPLDNHGLNSERYQQTFGGVDVFGAQLTVTRDISGTIKSVIGAYYSAIVSSNGIAFTPALARSMVEAAGQGQDQTVELLIDPVSGRYFYQVETRDETSRFYSQIDASSGVILNQFNTIDTLNFGEGIGVNGETRDLSGLTNYHGSGPPANRGYRLESSDGRQRTYDLNYRTSGTAQIVVDADNIWNASRQAAAVDAQFYANVTDHFYQEIFGRNSYDNNGATMNSVVHLGVNYDNAFWNGSGVYFGDGDGVVTQAYSAGLDVVAHEWTHAVTQYTSNLVYQGESGALNEAFSDIMAAAVEYYLADPDNDPSTDYSPANTVWLVGEDIDLRSASVETEFGFRNMKNPGEDGWYLGAFPDHYAERYTGTEDNGGVHVNSNIVNHAFYLLVEGGVNASGGTVQVEGIGFRDAQSIFYLAFTGLNSTANFQDARNATVAIATSLFGATSTQARAVSDAWLAVGVAPPTPDTTPPDAPVGLDAVPGDQQVLLDWDDNAESDLLGYNVYRSTTGASSDFVQINATPLADSAFTDLGLTNGVTYFYRVTAVDTSLNESVLFAQASATPEASTATVHVGAIEGSATLKANGRRWSASVVVTVHNSNHAPVGNATVSGTWTGAATGSVTGTTNADGTITFSTGNLSSGSSVTFLVASINGITDLGSDSSLQITLNKPTNFGESQFRHAPEQQVQGNHASSPLSGDADVSIVLQRFSPGAVFTTDTTPNHRPGASRETPFLSTGAIWFVTMSDWIQGHRVVPATTSYNEATDQFFTDFDATLLVDFPELSGLD